MAPENGSQVRQSATGTRDAAAGSPSSSFFTLWIRQCLQVLLHVVHVGFAGLRNGTQECVGAGDEIPPLPIALAAGKILNFGASMADLSFPNQWKRKPRRGRVTTHSGEVWSGQCTSCLLS